MSDWCILQCAGRSTLPLAASLTEDGLETWAPAETRVIRVPRVNLRRETRRPIMAGFVFAHARHLQELVDLAAMPIRPRRIIGGENKPAHPDFTVFRYLGEIRMVRDHDLRHLRLAESRAVPLAKLKPYARGDRVPGTGAFAGLTGIVESSAGQFTLVCFDGNMRVKIPTFVLRADEVGSGQPTLAEAA